MQVTKTTTKTYNQDSIETEVVVLQVEGTQEECLSVLGITPDVDVTAVTVTEVTEEAAIPAETPLEESNSYIPTTLGSSIELARTLGYPTATQTLFTSANRVATKLPRFVANFATLEDFVTWYNLMYHNEVFTASNVRVKPVSLHRYWNAARRAHV